MQEIHLIQLDSKDVPLYQLGPFRKAFFDIQAEEENRWIEASINNALRLDTPSESRAVVPGLKRFLDLSVSDVPPNIMPEFLKICGCYIIFPFNNGQIRELNNNISNCSDTLNQFKSDLAYNNLIEYVLDNKLSSKDLTAEIIEKEYQKFEDFIMEFIKNNKDGNKLRYIKY